MTHIFWIFTSISLSILLSSLVFNACGIFLLKSLRGNKLAQTVIIINLSVSEILIAIGWIAELIVSSIGLTFDDKPLLVIWAIRAGFYCFWFAVMYILSIDRFMGCIIPLQHRVTMTNRNIRRLMTGTWVACISSSIFLVILDTKSLFKIYNTYVWMSLDCIAVFIYTITYASIFIHTLKSKRMHRGNRKTSDNRQNANNNNLHFFKVVGVIMLSFVIFEFGPSMTEMSFYFTDNKIPEILDRSLRLCYQLNLLLDPLIYIFLQSRVRKLLFAKFRNIFHRNRGAKRRPAVSYDNAIDMAQ